MSGGARFDVFIKDLFDLYNGLEQQLGTNRPHVVRSTRRALAVLKVYVPEDDGEAILLEVAVEQFQALLRRAGGAP